MAWRNDEHLLELGLTWLPQDEIEYPIDKSGSTVSTGGEIPRTGVGLSYKRLFDTTLHAAPRYAAERVKERELAEKGALDSWGLLASPSSLSPLGDGDLPAPRAKPCRNTSSQSA